jgi:hypothetical protein
MGWKKRSLLTIVVLLAAAQLWPVTRDNPPERRAKRQADVGEELADDAMPPWFYVPLHGTAKLDASERDRLIEWSSGGAKKKPKGD